MLFFQQNNAFEQTQVWAVGVVYFEICFTEQRYILWKIENGFYWASTFIENICALNNSKMFFFKQNSAFEQTQFWTMGVVYYEICFT